MLDNGGPTLTHALLPGSPALEAADDAACRRTDQRETPRPQGQHCDLGAFERIRPVAPKIQSLVTFFDQSAATGELTGAGKTSGEQQQKLQAVRNQLLLTGEFLAGEATAPRACGQLAATRQRIGTDGTPNRDDYVTGTAASELEAQIESLQGALGCG